MIAGYLLQILGWWSVSLSVFQRDQIRDECFDHWLTLHSFNTFYSYVCFSFSLYYSGSPGQVDSRLWGPDPICWWNWDSCLIMLSMYVVCCFVCCLLLLVFSLPSLHTSQQVEVDGRPSWAWFHCSLSPAQAGFVGLLCITFRLWPVFFQWDICCYDC